MYQSCMTPPRHVYPLQMIIAWSTNDHCLIICCTSTPLGLDNVKEYHLTCFVFCVIQVLGSHYKVGRSFAVDSTGCKIIGNESTGMVFEYSSFFWPYILHFSKLCSWYHKVEHIGDEFSCIITKKIIIWTLFNLTQHCTTLLSSVLPLSWIWSFTFSET